VIKQKQDSRWSLSYFIVVGCFLRSSLAMLT